MELQLSKKQMDKITYEAMLMRMSPQQLYVVAPHLFIENITAANTVIEEPKANDETSIMAAMREQAKSYLDSLEDEQTGYLGY